MIAATAGLAALGTVGCSGGSGGSGVANNDNYKKLNSLTWEIAEEWSDDSYYYAVFKVTNTGDETIDYFEANFEFYDKSGKTINKDGTRYHDCPLEAGESACMWSLSDASSKPADVAEVAVVTYSYYVGDQKFTVNAVKETLQQRTDDRWAGYEKFDFDEVDILSFDFGPMTDGREQEVTVRNGGDDDVESAEICMAYYDKDGMYIANDRISGIVVDESASNVARMRPSQVSGAMMASITQSEVYQYSYVLDGASQKVIVDLYNKKAYGITYKRR